MWYMAIGLVGMLAAVAWASGRHGRVIAMVCVLGLLPACSEEREPSGPVPGADATTPPTAATEGPDVEMLVADAVRGPVRGNLATGAHAMVRVGEESFVARAGVANRRTGEKMTERHRHVAYSISAVAVAVVVVRLMADGRLRPKDRVAEHLPGLLRNGDRITLEQLLTHSSGLRDPAESPGTPRLVATTPARPELLVRRADALGPAFAPGSEASYSQTNALVLGMVVEEVSGRSLAEALERWVFAPAGMKDSSLGWDGPSGAPVAHGYADDKDVTATPAVDWAWAAGGVVSTNRDVRRFHDALFGGKLLPAPWLERMTTAPVEESPEYYAFGFGVTQVELTCGVAWGEWGEIPGYTSHAWTLEGGDRQVVLVLNSTDETLRATVPFEVVGHTLCSE